MTETVELRIGKRVLPADEFGRYRIVLHGHIVRVYGREDRWTATIDAVADRAETPQAALDLALARLRKDLRADLRNARRRPDQIGREANKEVRELLKRVARTKRNAKARAEKARANLPKVEARIAKKLEAFR